ncbi:hybrid sensor histidine kinase/response regulator transcription factor [Seonamhaeicola maritimus]|uniref:hybrid sensor histidine kinase/response regulator transcription factor n=1 Tax=Seonamhaeicola maritimus TaxID=2591822 RepID=UPI00249429EF|nr:two-component regulator propeller domain-containing protein [Seonamhaeicola maritimus]
MGNVLTYNFKKRVFLLAQSLLLCFYLGYAQAPDLKFEHFIDNKGLNQNSIMSMIQDNDGYLWIGTASGLYKYDGQRFTVYKHIINQPNSLVNNAVYELELDAQGNILIGTGRGMSKFDKLTETFHTYPKILKDERITSICPTNDGSLWVATLHSGLYRFKSTDTEGIEPEHFFHNPEQANSLDSNRVHSIVQDSKGNIWVATAKNLNKAYRTGTNSIAFAHFKKFEKPKLLFLDKDDNMWVGLSGRRLVRMKEPEKFRELNKDNFREYTLKTEAPDGLDFGGIIAINQGKDGNMWVGIHGNGLYWLNQETGFYKRYAPDPYKPGSLSSGNIETILIDNTNVLWVGTEVGGLNKSDLSKKDILHYRKDILSNNALSNSSINAITKGEDDNTIWVGTQNGLNKINFIGNDYKNPEFKHYYPNTKLANSEIHLEQPVRSVLKDKDNDYWLGTTEGIFHMSYNPNTEKAFFNLFNNEMFEVFSSLEDNNGNLWFGSFVGRGLIKWKKKRKPNSNEFDFSEAVHYSAENQVEHGLSGNEISCIYQDSKNQIWIGTLHGGLNLFIPGVNGEKDSFISYQHNPENPNSLSHNSVFSIHEDATGDYWIGTFGGGLNKMIVPKTSEGEVVFKHYMETDGLPDNSVYGILEDDNEKLWISTDNGISCFNPITESFKNFGVEDGLQSHNYRKNAYLRSTDGQMFFGGLRGLNVFNPEYLKDNTIPAKVKLTGFKIKNELVEVGKTYNDRVILDKSIAHLDDLVELKHHENTLTFEFAALHFAAPNKNKFKYQLDGFDEGWQDYKGLPFAHYTNLSPGSYSFKVIASNNDDIWNEQSAEMNFVISPPFWLTLWAYFVYGLIILGIILSIRSYYRLQSKERTATKIQKEMKEVNRLKLQFFTNISHEFKTPITLILTPLEEILESTKESFSYRPKLKVIERNANYLLRLVNQLMEFRKIEVGETTLAASKSNIINFTREITFTFKTLAKSKNIELSFESELYSSDVWFDWDKLEKVLNNLVFNAIKFTDKGGRVIVKVSKSSENQTMFIEEREANTEYVQIEVNDNGSGISKEQQPFIFQRFYQVNKEKNASNTGSGIGLAITKDLVDLHYGSIEVDSTEGVGSSFIIKLPLGNSHLQPEEMLEQSTPELLTEDELEAEFNIEEEYLDTLDTDVNHELSVLVIDDNNDIREVVKNGLSSKYQIFEAENGKEGLNIALREIPDLIVSDVLMPEMDGIELCHKLKTNIRTSHIPVILLTALNSVEHRIEGLESGADAYMPKPFKMKLLGVRVDKLIETRESLRKRFETEAKITPEKVTLNSLDQSFLEKIMTLMEDNMDDQNYWIEELAADMNTSRSTFFRKIKKLTGQAPSDFMRIVRLKRATQLLEQNQLTVAEIGYRVGFNDPGYFSKSFRKMYNQTPSQYAASKIKNNTI